MEKSFRHSRYVARKRAKRKVKIVGKQIHAEELRMAMRKTRSKMFKHSRRRS